MATASPDMTLDINDTRTNVRCSCITAISFGHRTHRGESPFVLSAARPYSDLPVNVWHAARVPLRLRNVPLQRPGSLTVGRYFRGNFRAFLGQIGQLRNTPDAMDNRLPAAQTACLAGP